MPQELSKVQRSYKERGEERRGEGKNGRTERAKFPAHFTR